MSQDYWTNDKKTAYEHNPIVEKIFQENREGIRERINELQPNSDANFVDEFLSGKQFVSQKESDKLNERFPFLQEDGVIDELLEKLYDGIGIDNPTLEQ